MSTSTDKVKTYKNGVKTVEQLREEGYKVRVYHGRMYEHSLLCGLSKREYEAEMGKGSASAYVDSIGGFTRVEVTTPDGQEVSGKYNFNKKQFNRKIGLQAAIGRALHHLEIIDFINSVPTTKSLPTTTID